MFFLFVLFILGETLWSTGLQKERYYSTLVSILTPQKSPAFKGLWRKIWSLKHHAYAPSPMRRTVNIHDVPWDQGQWTYYNTSHHECMNCRMDVSSDKTTRHHNPDDKYLKIHHHIKCVAIFIFSAGTKCFYDSRYMFGSHLNLITDKILIYIVPCILLHFQRFITYSWLVVLFCILVKRWAYLFFLRG